MPVAAITLAGNCINSSAAATDTSCTGHLSTDCRDRARALAIIGIDALTQFRDNFLGDVMYRRIRFALAAALGLALPAAVQVQASAQEVALQEDVAQSDASVADDYGKGYVDDCCADGCGSFYGELQFLQLDTYLAEAQLLTGGDIDEHSGYRLIGGYQGSHGLGLRARYFDFDGLEDAPFALPFLVGLELNYFDLEVTDTIHICNLHGVLSVGYRHADYELRGLVLDGALVDFEGDGLTFGASLARDLTCSLALFGWVQQSMLYGTDEGILSLVEIGEDNLMGWTEAQVGAQYNACLAGYDVVLRGGVEAQQHEGAAITLDTGLLGWFLSAGASF